MDTERVEKTIPVALLPQALLVRPTALAQHLRSLIDEDPSMENLNSINSCILDQVHTEAIPPFVYHVWLFLACRHSYHFIPAALRDPSYGVRDAAIKLIRHRLCRSHCWKERGWDFLGGAQGIKDILDQLPLAQVRLLVKAIFASCGSVDDRESVMACIEEFLTLVEKADSWATRPISGYVSFLYAFTTTEKVTELLRSQMRVSSTFFSDLGKFHSDLLRQIAIGATDMPQNVRREVLEKCQNSLLRSKEEYAPIRVKEVQPIVPPGLVFGADLLLVIAEEPNLQSDKEIRYYIEEILGLSFRAKLPFSWTLQLMNSSFALSRSRGSGVWLSPSLPEGVIQFWSMARFGLPGSWDKGLARKLQKGRRARPKESQQISLQKCMIKHVLKIRNNDLAVHRKHARFTKAVIHLLSLVDQKGRLAFLQMLCRYSPTLGFDLTAWPPSEKERQLVPVWGYDVLCLLPPTSSKQLFERSLHFYHCDEFVPSPDEGGPNERTLSRQQQCLLWADWESSAARGNGHFPITRKAIDDMKQRAMRARVHTERSQWTRSAIELAVRTQDLDVFRDVVDWSRRYLRDPLVFPNISDEIHSTSGSVLSCLKALQAMRPVSKSRMLEAVQKAHRILASLLETSLLVLREPWVEGTIDRLTYKIPLLFDTIVSERMRAVRNHISDGLVTEAELVEIFLDSLIPVIMDYEREGNADGQTLVHWSGPAGVTRAIRCPTSPSAAELSFMDRLAKARNQLWEQHRAQTNSDVLTLDHGWPRGLPIQCLGGEELWLYHALERPNDAPYLSSRVNEILFSSVDTIMTVVPKNIEPIEGFVDDFRVAIRAAIGNGERTSRKRHALRIWKHYSSILQPYPLYRELFEDWLNELVSYEDMGNVVDMIPARKMILPVPTGSEVTEWDPEDGCTDTVEDTVKAASAKDEGMTKGVPYTILNCRLEGKISSRSRFVQPLRPQSGLGHLSIWSFSSRSADVECRDASVCVQDPIVLSSLLFLDTYTKNPRILRAKFPNVMHPRYTPIYLADEFISRASSGKHGDPLTDPVAALEICARRTPSQILRDLIWSFLDTLQTAPNASMYSKLLRCTFDLTGVLLLTDQPHLAVDVVLRVWKDFPNDSSYHRRISLIKLGRILPPKQAKDMMQRFAEYVCGGLQTQQQEQQVQQQESTRHKPIIKVTTAKMFAQTLADADFLPQSTRIRILQYMYDVSRHIDIRREIIASILELVSLGYSAEPYNIFASIALSAAGPSERVRTTEDDWNLAENEEGPFPLVATDSDRPILHLVVSTASSKVPKRLKPDYVQKVLLPLLQESTRQHTRWMKSLAGRLGLSLSGLDITESEIGPFSPGLTDRILWSWVEHLPYSYLQSLHRRWALSYLHFASFSRIAEALAMSKDPMIKNNNVQDHWQNFFKSIQDRPALYPLDRLFALCSESSSKDFTDELVLEEFAFRAEVVARNPVRYNHSLKQYSIQPGYTLEVLRNLRTSRIKISSQFPPRKEQLYNQITEVMNRIVDTSERVRKDGWPSPSQLMNRYPTTVPTAFEYEIMMLPSPRYNPTVSGSVSALDVFISAILDLVSKHATDPVFLFKYEALYPIINEATDADKATCALQLGHVGQGQHQVAEICVRVKLAQMVLRDLRKRDTGLDTNITDMLEEWKCSDFEMVRQIGWECERSQ